MILALKPPQSDELLENTTKATRFTGRSWS
jgi:hypothetical protein